MLIKNGLIINPAAEESYKADLLIKDGIIMDIKENIVLSDSEEVIDAGGLTIAPRTNRHSCSLSRSGFHL